MILVRAAPDAVITLLSLETPLPYGSCAWMAAYQEGQLL